MMIMIALTFCVVLYETFAGTISTFGKTITETDSFKIDGLIYTYPIAFFTYGHVENSLASYQVT